jgi:hypothetical protein
MTTMPLNKLDAFDILNRAFHEIEHIAESVGVSFAKLLPLLCPSKPEYKKGIESDKAHKGKVKAWFEIKTAKSGQEYPVLGFNTLKGGGYAETFNGWQWLRENGLVGTEPLTESEKTAIQTKRAEREKQQALNAERHAAKQELTDEQKTKRFNDFVLTFNALPLLNDTTGTYLQRKGFTIENLPADFVLKRGTDWRGGFIVYSLVNASHDIVGFQKLYDKKFTDLSGNTRDKDFVFLPNSMNGSFAILGIPRNQSDQLYFAEGLATSLTSYLATGKPCVICLSAGNIHHVVKLFSTIKHFKKLKIAADNDSGKDGNTGFYKSLLTAKEFNCDIFYPVLTPVNDSNVKPPLHLKCDFNDIFIKQGIKEVKQQLKTNKLDFSEPVNYYFELIKSVPSNQHKDIKSYINSACFMIANRLLLSDDETVKNNSMVLQAIIDNRQLMFDGKPISAAVIISRFVARKIKEIKKANGIESIPDNVTVHNCTGKTNAEIQADIKKYSNAIWIDTRAMGAGKTELMAGIANAVKAYALDKNIYKQISYIAHRTALIKDASNRLTLDYYENVDWYNGDSPATLATTANSMINHKVANNVNVLFIDEGRQTLEHVLNGTCDKRLAVFNELENAIKNAGLVLIADADFNQFTLDWICSIANKDIHLIIEDSTPTGKKIIELKTNAVLCGHIKQDLLSGGNVWITTDSKSKAENMEEFLNSLNQDNSGAGCALKGLLTDTALKLTANDILLVTSENKADEKQAAFLANPNEESKKYRVIIHTPVISSGVSVTNGHFKNVYAIFCNVTAPNEMLQTIARVRTAKEIFCTFKTGYVKNRATNLQDLIDGEMVKRGRFSSPVLELTPFDIMRLKQVVNKNHALNDFKPYFFLLAQTKGYEVIPCQDDTEQSETAYQLEADLKVISHVVKERTINSIIDAERVDKTEHDRLDKLSATTQAQTNAIKRYTVALMTGKDNTGLFDADNDITANDVDFIIFNKGGAIIANYELLAANINELKDSDNANHFNRDKLASKTSKHLLFKTVIDGIERFKDSTFNSEQAAGICGFLQDHHKELAANGLGNYKNVSGHPIKQLTTFLQKIGYEVKAAKQDGKGVRWYAMTVNEQVQDYAIARAEYKKLLSNANAV